MRIQDIATLALRYWDYDNAIIAVAVALAESGGREDARGDHISIFDPPYQRRAAQFACNGYTSIGLWQIHMPAHYPRLQGATGSNNPCDWAAWLSIPDNNARVAHEIWQGSQVARGDGWLPWSTYKVGAHQRYLQAAKEAVDEVFYGPPAHATPPELLPPQEVAESQPHVVYLAEFKQALADWLSRFESFNPE